MALLVLVLEPSLEPYLACTSARFVEPIVQEFEETIKEKVGPARPRESAAALVIDSIDA